MRVIIIIPTKEKTLINQCMNIECMVNILYSLLGTFQQSPYYRGLHSELYCCPHLMLATMLVVCNRLIPVAIVTTR